MPPNREILDPYPFIFLNLILSRLAAVKRPDGPVEGLPD
jgi:uncharacterized membrane protein